MGKKSLSLILVLVLTLSLFTGCKSKDAKVVEKLIDSIGEVNVDSGAAIGAAEEAYNSLSISDKDSISNYDILEAAKDEYIQLFFGVWTGPTYVNAHIRYYDINGDLFATEGDVLRSVMEISQYGSYSFILEKVETGERLPYGDNYEWVVNADGTITLNGESDYKLEVVNGEYRLIPFVNPENYWTKQ